MFGAVFDDIIDGRFILQRVADFDGFWFLFGLAVFAFWFGSVRLVDFFDSMITQSIHFLLHIWSFADYDRPHLSHP